MHLNLVYYYVRDEDGSLWITNDSTLHKEEHRWMSTSPTKWRKISKNHKVLINATDLFDSFISDLDLSDMPEPSWSDSEPIVVNIKIDYSINYYTY